LARNAKKLFAGYLLLTMMSQLARNAKGVFVGYLLLTMPRLARNAKGVFAGSMLLMMMLPRAAGTNSLPGCSRILARILEAAADDDAAGAAAAAARASSKVMAVSLEFGMVWYRVQLRIVS
jgi:hypothetical protein